MPMRRNLSSYWQTNLFETVSGNFATELFDFHVDQIGLNRIMYSVSRISRCRTIAHFLGGLSFRSHEPGNDVVERAIGDHE
jgi:hypothetical protein